MHADSVHLLLGLFSDVGAPSSRILARVGYQKSIVIGLAVMGPGALLFYPAAGPSLTPCFWARFGCSLPGSRCCKWRPTRTWRQLGAPAKASSRFESRAGIQLPRDYHRAVSGRGADSVRRPPGRPRPAPFQLPYIGIALTLFLLAFGVSRFHLPSLPDIEEGHGVSAGDSIWKRRHLVLGAIAIFVYVGGEVSIGSFLVNYFSQPDIGGLTERAAAGYVSFYWGGAMVGRFIGSAVLRNLAPGKVLGGARDGCLCAGLHHRGYKRPLAMWSVIAVGLFNSVMFPTIFTLGIDQLGPLTGKVPAC